MNILVPCSLLAENIFRFFEVHTHPSIHHFGLDVPPCNEISEGRLFLCSTSLEAGALPSEVRIENDSDRKFSKSIFFQKFNLETTFIHDLWYAVHYKPKFFFRFCEVRTPHLPIDTPFCTRGFSLVLRSRKAGFPFATRARKREPCPQISNI